MTFHQQARIFTISMRLPVERVDQSGQEASFAFDLRGAVTALTAPQPGVEQVPDGIAEHVETIDDDCQAKSRPERQPGCHLHELPPFPAEHPSPARHLEGQPESQETERRLADNHRPDVDGKDDDDRRHNIGQHMAHQNSPFRAANRQRGLKIDILFDANHGAPDHSGAADPVDQPQDDDDLREPPSGNGHDG